MDIDSATQNRLRGRRKFRKKCAQSKRSVFNLSIHANALSTLVSKPNKFPL